MIYLPGSDYLSPTQALQQALNEANLDAPYRDVLIAAIDGDDELRVIFSHMSRERALWLAEELRDFARRVGRYAAQDD